MHNSWDEDSAPQCLGVRPSREDLKRRCLSVEEAVTVEEVGLLWRREAEAEGPWERLS